MPIENEGVGGELQPTDTFLSRGTSMNSTYSTVRELTTKSLCTFWEKPVDVELYEVDTPANYSHPQVGDFVVIHSNGKLRRATSNPTSRPYGLLIGFPPNAEVYPAFGGHYENRALTGVLTSNTELLLPFLNVSGSEQDGVGDGEYLPAEKENVAILPGSEQGLYYNSTTRRWGIGVQFTAGVWGKPTGANNRVRVIRLIRGHRYYSPEPKGDGSSYNFVNRGNYLFALVQVI
ncbi:MAG: hypothetical protein QXM12_06580 [Nitrososphaerota archaeon]